MNYIEMFDSLYGIAMGDAPSSTEPTLFLRTTDGGENWLSMNDSSLIGLWSGSVWKRVDFLDENIGYFFSYLDSPNRLYKTTDGGKNWTDLIDSIPCQVVKFYNEKIGIIKSGQCFGNICTSEVHRTTDGGLSWEITSSDTSIGWGQDIEFIPGNPSNVWLAAGNKVFFSSDTGKTWTKELHIPILHYRSGFLDIVFTDENHGWLLGREPGGSNDHLYYTKNGGMGGFVNVDDENEIPQKIYLSQNYPNPFNPTTTIKYQIPERSFVTIKVYDVLGNEIETLVNEEKPIGTYELTWYADNLPSAIYFYRLQAGDFIQTKKMILLR